MRRLRQLSPARAGLFFARWLGKLCRHTARLGLDEGGGYFPRALRDNFPALVSGFFYAVALD
jgi:hypothetical protein